jgi:uncharacterized protein YcsI (UPF0317 family)
MATLSEAAVVSSPTEYRLQCRGNRFTQTSTSGLCPGYAQANVIILPEKYAEDFRMLCLRNPVSYVSASILIPVLSNLKAVFYLADVLYLARRNLETPLFQLI